MAEILPNTTIMLRHTKGISLCPRIFTYTFL